MAPRYPPGPLGVVAEYQEVAPYSSSTEVGRDPRGPVGSLTVIPNGPPPIAKNLAQWLVYSLVVGVLVAYVAMHSLGRGAHYLQVFRITGTVAIIAYGVSYIPDSIWNGSA